MHQQYTYEEALTASQRVNWRVEDLIGGEKRLDFRKPFMPQSLARTESLGFLNGEERLALNHIRAHGYLYIFGVVEEFILPFVLDHAREHLRGDDSRTRAFLGFASEEAKHIDLFKRFRHAFREGFKTECAVIGPPAEFADAVLSHDPLAVALVILQIEWMTQRHYVDSVKDDRVLDPMFKSLLRHHWMEESQHAKLDTLMVGNLAAGRTEAAIQNAIQEYFEIGGLIDGGLKQQTIFDLESLTQVMGRRLSQAESDEFLKIQHQSQRWTFLGSGMSHPNFLATVQDLLPAARHQVEKAAAAFS